MTMTDGKVVAQAFLDGIAGNDAIALNRILHNDVKWWGPVSALQRGVKRPQVGRDEVVALLSGARGYFQPGTTRWTVFGLIEEGGSVVAHVRRECLTARGSSYNNEYLFRLDIVDGRIAEAWEQTDTLYATECLGADPPAGRSEP